MRASLRRIARTRPQARPSSAWARPQSRHLAASSIGFVVGALGAHQLARSDAVVSFDDMDRATKAEKSKKLKTKQEHPTHSALDGGRVTVDVDEEDLELMTLEEVEASRATLAHDGGDGRLLCTYDGIVYDVTSFADAHPGGRELLLTASGMDLKHFFENYTVHGHSDKAANWLAPLAVGKLSPEDALEAQKRSTPENHVRRRLARLRASRRRLLAIACSLPAAIAVRKFISFVGNYVSSSVAKWLARRIPFLTVPGYSKGAEPLPQGKKRGTVAVVGGGIAGCGAAWMLARDGFDVVLYEARPATSGNARTFDWVDDVWRKTSTTNVDEEGRVKSCVSVTAWPSLLYKNYTALLKHLNVETCAMPLSWFLNSKVPGYEGTLWGADPNSDKEFNTLRDVFRDDFRAYERAEYFARRCTDFFCLAWAPWKRGDSRSMYTNHTGLGLLNPLNVVPLYTVFRAFGGTDAWWDIVFTPYYTASFLVDELRPFPAVFGPIIEAQIPLNPTPENSWHGSSDRAERDCVLTTCVTWKDAGAGIRGVFKKLVEGVDVRVDTRVLQVQLMEDGRHKVVDEHDNALIADRVIFACPSAAAATMIKKPRTYLENAILSTVVYADDHHPATGHMHAVMHSDSSVVDEKYRAEFLRRGSNYVEVTQLQDKSINIENQYNFGVQTPGAGRGRFGVGREAGHVDIACLGRGEED